MMGLAIFKLSWLNLIIILGLFLLAFCTKSKGRHSTSGFIVLKVFFYAFIDIKIFVHNAEQGIADFSIVWHILFSWYSLTDKKPRVHVICAPPRDEPSED